MFVDDHDRPQLGFLSSGQGEVRRGYMRDCDVGAAVRRHYWELAVLYGLQSALRSGEVWVVGSRRWGDPAGSLIPTER